MQKIMHPAIDRILEKARAGGMPDGAFFIAVDVGNQRAELYRHCEYICSFPVSTSRFGIGNVMESEQTPLGFHEVVERFGDGLPAGAIFTSRLFAGSILPPAQWSSGEGDMILSRILRLGGKEPGRNSGGSCDTYDRFIYFHGTNHEYLVGVKPSSHGCIRMRNLDIIALYDTVRNDPVWCWIGYPE
ncbi:MAG TPA: L,D-transpeptidase [Kiritimatiellia bacterium]|mgnify:CR=1 FL=1|nr:L,D-transpeptidase [Kiritimatiellia bacterium]